MKKIERVVLTYPNQLWFKEDLTTTWNLNPYTICLLATMIKDDVEVKIIDAQFYDMTHEEFKAEIAAFKPDLVGISQMTSEYASIAHEAAADVKSVNPDIITLMGGAHVTTMHWEVMEDPNIDYAIAGEGEYVFRDFIRYLNGDGPFPTKGMVYRENGKVNTLPKELIQDLDALPFADFSFVDFPTYTNTVQRYGTDAPTVLPFIRMPTVRGCPVGCTFCQVENISGAPFRRRSPEKLVAEFESLIENYGIKYITFDDDNTFYNKHHTRALLKLMIERKLDLKWKANGVAVFCIDREIIDLMAEAGCEMINYAIESGVDRVLKQIVHKPINLKKAPEMIQYARSKGIFVCVNFILGFPGETWDEIRQTLYYAEACGADYVKLFIANPIHGTKLFDMAKEMDVITGDEYEINWRYSKVKTQEFRPIDISILRAYEWDRINFTDPEKRVRTAKIMNITLEELEDIRRKTREVLDFETLSKGLYPSHKIRTKEDTESLVNMAKMMN